MKKLLTALLTLAMAFTMVFATAASAEDGYKDSITWVIGNDQDILDPQNNVSNSKVIPQYYDGLLGYDNDGNVVCKMAESYEASEDKMTWTFHLRQDVYFHSGRHCTAHDFEATFDRLLNTENPQRYTSNASFIDTAVATDDYTFVITLKEPKAFFLQAIAKQWAFVLNPEYIEKYGADLGKTAESVDGTGPFKCTQWDKGEVMKFEAFENYYEGAPLTHEIVMKIVPEQTSRAIAVETAQADIADGVSPDDAVRLDALDGVTVSKTDGNGCHLFQFNCASDHAPMSIPAVRQAICYAIDRNAICEYLYSGLGETPMTSSAALTRWSSARVRCSASRRTRPTPCGCCARSPGVSTASTPASASAGAAVPPPLSRQPLSISRPSRRTTCAPTCARRSPTTRREPMPSRGTRRCGVRASKGATTTSWGCRFTARRSCCASLPDPDSPGNGSLYGENLQLFYMLFRENTRYVYQRHRH